MAAWTSDTLQGTTYRQKEQEGARTHSRQQQQQHHMFMLVGAQELL